MVLPCRVREYSTAAVLDLVTRRAIKPQDSRRRRVLVSMRCEIHPRRRRSSPWRCGLSLRENKTMGVHLPIKIAAGVFDSCISIGVIGVPCLLVRSHVDLFVIAHKLNLARDWQGVGVTSVAGFRWIR
jgi:hypothetical protein